MDRPRRSQRVLAADTPAESSPRHSQQPTSSDQRLTAQTVVAAAAAAQIASSSAAIDGDGEPAVSNGTSKTYKYKAYHALPSLPPSHPGVPAPSWPLSSSSAPQKPQTAIAHGQALHTTFPSRMKLGVSTLMQPLPPTGDQSDPMFGRSVVPSDHHYGASMAEGSRRSGRSTMNRKRYVEEMSDFEEDDSDDDGDDDGADTPGGRASGMASPRKSGLGASSRGTPSQLPFLPPAEEREVPGQRLGLPPPANKLTVKRANRTPHVYYSDADQTRAADHREILIPIRLELETETHRVKDCISWNANERLITPHQFVKVFLQDLDLPYDIHGPQLEASIHQQIETWSPLAQLDISPARGGIWACRSPSISLGEKRRADIKDEREKGKDARPYKWGIEKEFKRYMKGDRAKKRRLLAPDSATQLEGQSGEWEDDLRVNVDYEVQILHHTLRDRFEWDVSSALTPEAFAAQTCRDIGLSGEACPIISSAIRENLLKHKQAIMSDGLIGLGEMWGKAVEDEESALRDIENERRRAQLEKSSGRGRQSMVAFGGGSAEQSPTPTREFLSLPTSAPMSTTPSLLARSAQSPTPTPTPIPTPNLAPDVATPLGEPTTPADPTSTSTPPPDPRHLLLISRSIQSDLISRGPRLLTSAWRDFFESKNFGPILEWITEEEIVKMETEAIRTSRRNRRDVLGRGAWDDQARETRYRAR